MQIPTYRSPASRPRRFFSPVTLAILLVLLAGLLFTACGDPLTLRQTVSILVKQDEFGGSFARLYATGENDRFYDVEEFQDTIHVVGGINRSVTDQDGVLLRINRDGSIVSRQRFTSADSTIPYTEEYFSGIDVGFGVENGETRLILGGTRATSGGDREGVIMQLLVGGSGAAITEAWEIATAGADVVIKGVTADDGMVGVGYTDLTIGSERPLVARIPYGSGTNLVSLLDNGAQGSFEAIERSDEGNLVAAGYNFGGSDFDALMAGISNATLNTIPVSGGTRFDFGGQEYIYAMTRMSGPERYVAVGSTNAFFGGQEAWLVMVVTWNGSGTFTVERAFAIQVDPNIPSSARAVLALEDTDNFYGESDLIAITGNNNQTILMSITGDLKWAAQRGDASKFLNSDFSRPDMGITANDRTFRGFYITGTNSPDSTRQTGQDGALLWALPEDGTSFPETESTDGTVTIRNILGDLTTSDARLVPSGSATIADVVSEYTVDDVPQIEIVQ